MAMMMSNDDDDVDAQADAPLLRARDARADEMEDRIIAASRNPAVDVYSFAITAWELMARTTPYNDMTTDAEVSR